MQISRTVKPPKITDPSKLTATMPSQAAGGSRGSGAEAMAGGIDPVEFEFVGREEASYMAAVRIAPNATGTGAAFLELRPVENPPPMPEELRTLLAKIESTDSLIRLVTPPEKRLARYQRLRGIALMGLCGKDPDPASAAHLLENFRNEDLSEDLKGNRNAYILANIRKMGIAGLAGLILGCLLWFDVFGLSSIILPTATAGEVSMDDVLSFVAAALFGVTGFAVGDVFTSLWSAQTVDPDTFRTNRRFRFSGWLRLTFGLALWIALLALLAVDWIILGVGGVTINEATQGQPLLGFVGGLVVALAFDQAGRAVGERAKQALRTDKD